MKFTRPLCNGGHGIFNMVTRTEKQMSFSDYPKLHRAEPLHGRTQASSAGVSRFWGNCVAGSTHFKSANGERIMRNL